MPEPEPVPATLQGWLAYLERLHPKSIALGLDRVGQVKDRLGLDPASPIITVAGTNGKGSTCAMLERIYIEAGRHVACYTSPHLLRYNERVRVDGKEASDAQLCEAFAAVEQARQDITLTYFEFGTLAAMWYFIRAGVDVAILEVGLGGRLDAVNIFDPSCAIVTSVDLDHQDYLGHSRDDIGLEKAGIYRKGVAALCGEMSPPAALPNHARTIGADYRQIGVDFGFEAGETGWTFFGGGETWKGLPLPALSGHFQLGNAACALEAIRTLQPSLPVSRDAVVAGLRHVALAGRYQTFDMKPEVILDVAHNPHAARGLADNLRHSVHRGRTLAVFAMLNDKDIGGVVRSLAQVVDTWFVAGIEGQRGADTGMLAGAVLQELPNAQVQCFPDVRSAFRQACLSAGENDRIIALGSFFTVADVLRELPETKSCN